jgi:hypothetical protein
VVHHEVAASRDAAGHAKLSLHPVHATAPSLRAAASSPGIAAPASAATRITSSSGFISVAGFTTRTGVVTTRATRLAVPASAGAGVSPAASPPSGITAGSFIGTAPNALGNPYGTSVNGNPMTFTSSVGQGVVTPFALASTFIGAINTNNLTNSPLSGTFIGANNSIGFPGGFTSQAGFSGTSTTAGNFTGSEIAPVSSTTTVLPFSQAILPFGATPLPFGAAPLPFSA